jgi:hypothetical protein
MAFTPLTRLLVFLFITLMVHHVGAMDFYPITSDDTNFLAQVVKAIDKKHTIWIADHMFYPLSVKKSNRTQVVNTKAEFIPILKRELSDSIRARIRKDSKKPLFKNWQGVMAGDGILWFGQLRLEGHISWSYQILAMGNFAYQPEDTTISGP